MMEDCSREEKPTVQVEEQLAQQFEDSRVVIREVINDDSVGRLFIDETLTEENNHNKEEPLVQPLNLSILRNTAGDSNQKEQTQVIKLNNGEPVTRRGLMTAALYDLFIRHILLGQLPTESELIEARLDDQRIVQTDITDPYRATSYKAKAKFRIWSKSFEVNHAGQLTLGKLVVLNEDQIHDEVMNIHTDGGQPGRLHLLLTKSMAEFCSRYTFGKHMFGINRQKFKEIVYRCPDEKCNMRRFIRHPKLDDSTSRLSGLQNQQHPSFESSSVGCRDDVTGGSSEVTESSEVTAGSSEVTVAEMEEEDDIDGEEEDMTSDRDSDDSLTSMEIALDKVDNNGEDLQHQATQSSPTVYRRSRGKKCSVPECPSYQYDVAGNSTSNHFFHMPNNPTLAQKWEDRIGVAGLRNNQSARICDRHFKASDTDITVTGKVRLRQGVMPSIFSWGIVSHSYRSNEPKRRPQKLGKTVHAKTWAVPTASDVLPPPASSASTPGSSSPLSRQQNIAVKPAKSQKKDGGRPMVPKLSAVPLLAISPENMSYEPKYKVIDETTDSEGSTNKRPKIRIKIVARNSDAKSTVQFDPEKKSIKVSSDSGSEAFQKREIPKLRIPLRINSALKGRKEIKLVEVKKTTEPVIFIESDDTVSDDTTDRLSTHKAEDRSTIENPRNLDAKVGEKTSEEHEIGVVGHKGKEKLSLDDEIEDARKRLRLLESMKLKMMTVNGVESMPTIVQGNTVENGESTLTEVRNDVKIDETQEPHKKQASLKPQEQNEHVVNENNEEQMQVENENGSDEKAFEATKQIFDEAGATSAREEINEPDLAQNDAEAILDEEGVAVEVLGRCSVQDKRELLEMELDQREEFSHQKNAAAIEYDVDSQINPDIKQQEVIEEPTAKGDRIDETSTRISMPDDQDNSLEIAKPSIGEKHCIDKAEPQNQDTAGNQRHNQSYTANEEDNEAAKKPRSAENVEACMQIKDMNLSSFERENEAWIERRKAALIEDARKYHDTRNKNLEVQLQIIKKTVEARKKSKVSAAVVHSLIKSVHEKKQARKQLAIMKTKSVQQNTAKTDSPACSAGPETLSGGGNESAAVKDEDYVTEDEKIEVRKALKIAIEERLIAKKWSEKVRQLLNVKDAHKETAAMGKSVKSETDQVRSDVERACTSETVSQMKDVAEKLNVSKPTVETVEQHTPGSIKTEKRCLGIGLMTTKVLPDPEVEEHEDEQLCVVESHSIRADSEKRELKTHAKIGNLIEAVAGPSREKKGDVLVQEIEHEQKSSTNLDVVKLVTPEAKKDTIADKVKRKKDLKAAILRKVADNRKSKISEQKPPENESTVGADDTSTVQQLIKAVDARVKHDKAKTKPGPQVIIDKKRPLEASKSSSPSKRTKICDIEGSASEAQEQATCVSGSKDPVQTIMANRRRSRRQVEIEQKQTKSHEYLKSKALKQLADLKEKDAKKGDERKRKADQDENQSTRKMDVKTKETSVPCVVKPRSVIFRTSTGEYGHAQVNQALLQSFLKKQAEKKVINPVPPTQDQVMLLGAALNQVKSNMEASAKVVLREQAPNVVEKISDSDVSSDDDEPGSYDDENCAATLYEGLLDLIKDIKKDIPKALVNRGKHMEILKRRLSAALRQVRRCSAAFPPAWPDLLS